MRVDGKFTIGNDIPEGQGSVNDLMAECFELSYELRVAAETEDGDDDDHVDDQKSDGSKPAEVKSADVKFE